MPQIRIRAPFAASFAALILISAYLGLGRNQIPQYGQSDKGLHFVTFFLLTITFYWILETSRRRLIHLTLIVCTAGFAIGSEFVQALLPDNGRDFDPYDILANVVGSALGLALCSWYHRRMLDRKRKNRQYDIVPGDEVGDDLGEDEHDLELGEGPGVREQESGTVRANGDAHTNGTAGKPTNVTEELDNWDENEEDWEDGPADDPDAKNASAEERKWTD